MAWWTHRAIRHSVALGLGLLALTPAADATSTAVTTRYLVGITTQASARAGSGTLEAVAIVRVADNRLTVERVLDAAALPANTTPPTGLDPGYTRLFGHALVAWQDLAMAPDGPTVGSSWVQAWRATTGQPLDGAVAIEATALARVLSASGVALRAPDGTAIRTRAAMARELTIGMIERTPGSDARSRRIRTAELAPALRALATRSATALLRAITPSLADGRSWIFRTDASAQRALETAGRAGWIGSIPAHEVRLRLNNRSGTWAEVYLRVQVSVRRPSAEASVVTVRLHLDPRIASATSPLIRAEDSAAGATTSLETLYSVGLAVHTSTVLVNGHHIVTHSAWYDGHPTVLVPVEVGVGADVTLTYTMTGRADIAHILDGTLPSAA